MEGIAQYVKRRGITCEIVKDRGAQVEDGWEHHAYVVALVLPTGERIETPWKQGYGIETSPEDTPERVLDALVRDSTDADTPFEEWCAGFGYDTDSRKAHATWEQCAEVAMVLGAFLGGSDELDYLRYEVEGL